MRPRRTGWSGFGPTKPVHTSVPPESEPSQTSDFTCSYTQSKPSAGNGAPVEPIARRALKSNCLPGSRPAARQAIRKGALTPKQVTASSSARRYRALKSGHPGEPS